VAVTEQNADYGVIDQDTLNSYDRALARLRDAHEDEFRSLLAVERGTQIDSSGGES
jgi:hypothetical protein